MRSGMVRVTVPGSTANLGPGFDSLGMALPLYTRMEMRPSKQTRVILNSPSLEGLPEDKSNLVCQMIEYICRKAGETAPELEISMESDIPLTRGLGSSAAAIVGGLLLGNACLPQPFSEDAIFQMATRIEGHPDNVAASLFGGLVVTAWDGEKAFVQKLQPPERLCVTVAVPSFQLSTERARNVLPKSYSRKDVVFNLSHTALLVAAMAAGSYEGIRHAMKDCLHQPYRMALVPGMKKILLQGSEHGALGCALSGAGPTVLAFSEGRSEELERFMEQTFLQEGIQVQVMRFSPLMEGAAIEEETA